MEQKPEDEKTNDETVVQPEPENNDTSELDSLESPSTVEESSNESGNVVQPSIDNTGVTDTTHGEKIKKKRRVLSGINKFSNINIYFLLFILLIVVALIITFIGYQNSKKEADKNDALFTEPLSEEALSQLKQSDVRVGGPKQILSIESNAIFSGKVLVRDSLEVAGQLKIGGPLNLPGITVSGNSNFDQVKIKSLEVAGNTSIQGQLSIQQGLTVGGNLNVGGNLSASQLTLNNLQLNGNISLNGHIDAGGGTPSKSNGGALGSGGTSSVSGTDTAGTVNISTGGGSGKGCFVTVNFVKKFNTTPHVVITPVGSSAGSINYYINRSSTGFSICTASSTGGGKSFSFDYIVID